MAELGFDVLGLDVDQAKIDKLNAGEVPFFEPGLDELLRKNVDAGNVRFTTSYDEIAEFGDVHFMCAGTPQKRGEYAADLTQVNSVVNALGPRLQRECLVVGKSTVPSGTAARIARELTQLSPAGEAVELAWNPEFLREGYAVEDTLHPDRLVFGVHEEGGRGEEILREVYAPIISDGVPVIVTDYATAELVKVAANAFLATKISFINAMAEVCEAVSGDVTALAEALGHDSRIGRRFLHPGLGFGGGCLPKDIRAFMARAGELGVDQALSFLREVDAINGRRRVRMVDLARELVDGSFVDHRIAVLGAAFKPNSDDIRDSPALDVADAIRLQGATVTVYDPAALHNARRDYPRLNYAESAAEAARDADAVLHLTEWHEFTEMDPSHLSDVVRHKRIVDGRNALDAERWRAAGWTYRALGRP
ncbi:MAG: UDPglucose 6-dehydrogenase [Frankiales bacterium]|jgi:UDPglucose 6-dehydrogenase|nr:UDPglucose 6-dehydrogenase [Frankiales bacterium]